MIKTWVVAGDFQIPFHEPTVVALWLGFIRDLKPDGVVLNGDVTDCYAISSFDRNPLQPAGLAHEVAEAGRLLRAIAPHAKEKIWLGGNHEDRLRRFIWKHAPQLAGLGDLEFPSLFHLADHGFVWRPYGDLVRLGELVVTHGSMVRKASGATARAHFEKYGQNVMVNHTHRLAAYYHTNLKGPNVAYENGCLCSLKPEYVQFPDWQHGWSVVHVDDATGFFHVQQIPVLGTCFYYGGTRYGAAPRRR